ncbi:MFS transporter [Klenkia sp. PcliD-1-E]|uniref:MFS transporter n=1 Tax=Klenkia sp. PcliD-1-E TaxID=2954492 RepID=UPI002097F580|nr:MFS transporter [Klenkia sp. PcliD-1-E]MCO7220712.1 MFS transporter [Klenkia sp. PcliD-1-E]
MSDRTATPHGFGRFWTASTVTGLGAYATTVAIGVLVEVELGGTALDLGWVNAARWAPYLLVGLVAGVLADRVRRRPLLAGADLARAAVLGVVPLLAALGVLTLPVLTALVGAFGLASVVGDAAQQSFLPRLVGTAGLGRANTWLQQGDAAAQGVGPLVGGALAAAGAPLALLVGAVGHLVSAGLVLATPLHDPRPARAPRRAMLAELREGVRWVYRHPTLRPLALGTHVWFVANAAIGTVTVTYLLTVLDVGAFGLGTATAAAGAGTLLGTSAADRVGRRTGGPGTVVGGRLVEAAGVLLLVVLPQLPGPALLGVVVAQLLFGFGMGVEGPFEMSHRQAVTPDRLQGRTNATMRSLNRAAVIVGAPAGGALALATSPRVALVAAAAVIAVSSLALARSGFRHADELPAARPGKGLHQAG